MVSMPEKKQKEGEASGSVKLPEEQATPKVLEDVKAEQAKDTKDAGHSKKGEESDDILAADMDLSFEAEVPMPFHSSSDPSKLGVGGSSGGGSAMGSLPRAGSGEMCKVKDCEEPRLGNKCALCREHKRVYDCLQRDAAAKDKHYGTKKFSEEFKGKMDNADTQAREFAEFRRLYPEGKPGVKRGKVEYACLTEVKGSETSTTDRIKTKLMDYREFAIYFRDKKGWKDPEVQSYWRELQADPKIERKWGGRVKGQELQLNVPCGVYGFADRKSYHGKHADLSSKSSKANANDYGAMVAETQMGHSRLDVDEYFSGFAASSLSAAAAANLNNAFSMPLPSTAMGALSVSQNTKQVVDTSPKDLRYLGSILTTISLFKCQKHLSLQQACVRGFSDFSTKLAALQVC